MGPPVNTKIKKVGNSKVGTLSKLVNVESGCINF